LGVKQEKRKKEKYVASGPWPHRPERRGRGGKGVFKTTSAQEGGVGETLGFKKTRWLWRLCPQRQKIDVDYIANLSRERGGKNYSSATVPLREERKVRIGTIIHPN